MKASKIKKIILETHTNNNKEVFYNYVENNIKFINQKLYNKKILIIGAAGSIGSEFTKLITKYNLKEICIVDTNENKTTDLIRNIRYLYPETKTKFITYCCNINDNKIINVLKKTYFDHIYNFAALKHVRTESNISNIKQMIETNVLIINSLKKIISKNKSSNILMMSTDKAANPENIMGATKRWMEIKSRILLNNLNNIKCVRFGNIVLSDGSYSSYIFKQIINEQTFPVPFGIKRFFYSKIDAASICLIVSLFGKNKQIYFPNSKNKKTLEIKNIVEIILKKLNFKIKYTIDVKKSKAIFKNNLKNKIWTCVKSIPDTTGEKNEEIFYTKKEIISYDFNNLLAYSEIPEYSGNFQLNEKNLLKIMKSQSLTKTKFLTHLTRLIKTFSYVEKNKSLNNKF